RCDSPNRSTGREAGRGNRGKAWGSACSYRTCLAVTEEAGDGAYHRGNEDHASGRCRRRSVRETDPGRGRISGRAVCAASHRRSSVNRKRGTCSCLSEKRQPVIQCCLWHCFEKERSLPPMSSPFSRPLRLWASWRPAETALGRREKSE